MSKFLQRLTSLTTIAKAKIALGLTFVTALTGAVNNSDSAMPVLKKWYNSVVDLLPEERGPRILFIRSEASDEYEQRIIFSFIESIHNKYGENAFIYEFLMPDRPCLICKDETCLKDNETRTDNTQKYMDEEWEARLKKVIARFHPHIESKDIKNGLPKIDYIVTTGSYATLSVIHSNLVARLQATGQLFLGVTDPFFADVIKDYQQEQDSGATLKRGFKDYGSRSMDDEDTFHRAQKLKNYTFTASPYESDKPNPNDKYYITGIQYGMRGGSEYAKIADGLFNKYQKIIFPYSEFGLQDRSYWSALDAFNKSSGQTRFESLYIEYDKEHKEKEQHISWTDIPTYKTPSAPPPLGEPVYIAWHDLDDLNSRYADSKDGARAMILSTCSPSNLDETGMIVSVVDKDIGQRGSEILIENFKEKDQSKRSVALGIHPIEGAPLKVWINSSVIRTRFPAIYENLSEAYKNRKDVDCSDPGNSQQSAPNKT